VAESGERKSTVDTLALRSILKFEREIHKKYSGQSELYKRKIAHWEKAQNAVTKKNRQRSVEECDQAIEKIGPRPEPPLEPMIVCSEPTIEGLIKLLHIGQPAIGLFSDEGGQFLGGFGMSKDHRLKTVAAFSSMWDGKPIKRVRAGEGSLTLYGRRVSSHLMVQPRVSDMLMGDETLEDQGFLSRINVTAPTSIMGTRFWREDDAQFAPSMNAYERQMERILRRPLPLQEGTQNELNPPVLPFSASAAQVFKDFVNAVETKLKMNGEFVAIKGYANKMPEHASRMAAVSAIFNDPELAELPAEAMERGIDLANYFAGELLRLKSAGWLDPNLVRAERLRVWLVGTWSEEHISTRAIMQYAPSEFRISASDNEKSIECLVRHGWLVLSEGGVSIKGRHSQKAWRVVRCSAA